eukprot:gene9487-biopygen6747
MIRGRGSLGFAPTQPQITPRNTSVDASRDTSVDAARDTRVPLLLVLLLAMQNEKELAEGALPCATALLHV